MLKTPLAPRGMVTSPHHLASQSGLHQLRSGGSAIEAVVAATATLTAVYPHMVGLGGDGFWLISEPGRPPIGIRAAGRSGRAVDVALYRRHGCTEIPLRGPLAANTVAGAVDGWRLALDINRRWGHWVTLDALFEDAIHYAEHGVFASRSQAELTREGLAELADLPGFASLFLRDGQAPREGERLTNPALAHTYRRLARDGLDAFYRGELARGIAADLARAGSPITTGDLAEHHAGTCELLRLRIGGATMFNHPPPTQGVASLMILGLLDRLELPQADGFAHIHATVEATKLAFVKRDRHVGDPARASADPAALLSPATLDELARRIDPQAAAAWGSDRNAGDTVWLAAIDAAGRAVSYIQSHYFDFGSGIVLPDSGIVWQNRGASFTLDAAGPRALAPATLPFHTLNPAYAAFDDGRRMVFGAMGGDGQPQTQAAIFTRYARFGQGLQDAVSAPRWLLGRRWADQGASLKLEDRFDAPTVEALRAAGHDVEMVAGFDDLMGHAGAVVRHADATLEGAADPRSDGAVAAW